MPEEPMIYARLFGDVLEVVTDRLTFRTPAGALVPIEDHVRSIFSHAAEVRIMTLEEAPWVLSRHVIAPPLQRAA